jgi:hypothetical protein
LKPFNGRKEPEKSVGADLAPASSRTDLKVVVA